MVAGKTDGGADTSYDIAVARRKGTDGSADNTFNGNGRTTVGHGAYESATAVAVQPDNKVVTAGQSLASSLGGPPARGFLVQRLTAVGLPDTSFGNPADNGAAFVDFGGQQFASELELLPGGKIAVVGDNAASGARDVVAARLTGGGALDSSFGVGGKRTIALPNDQLAVWWARGAAGRRTPRRRPESRQRRSPGLGYVELLRDADRQVHAAAGRPAPDAAAGRPVWRRWLSRASRLRRARRAWWRSR